MYVRKTPQPRVRQNDALRSFGCKKISYQMRALIASVSASYPGFSRSANMFFL